MATAKEIAEQLRSQGVTNNPFSASGYELNAMIGQSNGVGAQGVNAVKTFKQNQEDLGYQPTEGLLFQKDYGFNHLEAFAGVAAYDAPCLCNDLNATTFQVETQVNPVTAFQLGVKAKTGKTPIAVNFSRGGLGINSTSNAVDNWDAGNRCWIQMVDKLKAAQDYTGLEVQNIIYFQGEAENGVYDTATLQPIFEGVMARINAEFPNATIQLIGIPSWAAHRAMCQSVAANLSYVEYGYGCENFTVGNGLMSDTLHVSIEGANLVGSELANNIY